MSGEAETAAFADGEGVGEAAGRLTERADVLAYLARKRANAQLVANRSPEFADDAQVIRRQIEVLHDDIAAGLHEGESVVGIAVLAATADYPFRDHRTVEAADSAGAVQ